MGHRLAVVAAVLRSPVLRRVEGAFLLFSIAEWATWLGVIVYAYAKGGAAEAGVVAFAIFVPSILVAPGASTIGDRFARARMLLASYVVQAVTMAFTAVAVATGPPIVAYVFAMLTATSITLTRPANSALLPEVVVTPDELTAANAAMGTIEGLGALLGPILAGLLIGLNGPWLVYAATAVGAVIGAVAIWPVARAAGRRPAAPTDVASADPGFRGTTGVVLRDLARGAQAIAADRRLVGVFLVLAGSIALLGALNVFYAVLTIDLLGLPNSAVGYLAAASGLGALVGAASSVALVGRERLGRPLIGAACLFAVSVSAVAFAGTATVASVILLGAGAGWAFVYVSARTFTQRLAGDDVMSRVFGFMEATLMTSQALGALAVPVLVAVFGATGAMVVAGALLAIAALVTAPTLLHADAAGVGHQRELAALRAVPMFGPLSALVLERLASVSTIVRIAPGVAVVTEGDLGDRFFVILSGRVEVWIGGALIRTEGPGDSFGEIALIRDVPRTATVRTVDEVELVVLERAPFLEALTGQPRSRAIAQDVADDRFADSAVREVPEPGA